MNRSTPGLPVRRQLLEFTQTHVHWVSDAIQPSHLLLSPSPPAHNPSQHQGLFQWVNSSHEVAKVLVLPMNTQGWSPLEWTGWISLQSGTLKSLLQHHSLKAWIPQCSAFSVVHLSHLYMTAGKTIALARRIFVSKIISLLFHMLFRFVIAFLSRSKHLLISWLQSLFAVILEPQENKVCHCFHCFPNYLPWSNGTRCHDLSFLNVVLSQLFHSPLSPSSRSSLVPLCFLPLGWYHLHIWGY